MKNCLFRDIWNSAVQVSSTATVTWPCTVLNCTVFRTWRGVECSAGADATVRNCILTSCTSYGIWKDASASVSESYNSFWLNANNASFSPLDGNDLTSDPKFVNTTAADLYERFYLNQGPSTTSPCVNAGYENDVRFLTTALDKHLDLKPVDIGYHYPVRGHLRVTPSYFFEFEDGEPFYPISGTNKPEALEDRWTGGSDANFYPTTVPLYLQVLANHGLNTMRVYTSKDSLSLQYKEGDDFVTTTVKALDKYFNKLEDKGFVYGLATYDSAALGAWYSVYNDSRRPPAGSPPSRYKTAGTPPFPADTLPSTYPGTVAATTITLFFLPDEGARTAQRDFKHSHGEFLDSQYAGPKWWTQKGLIGWDLFDQIDDPEMGWAWDEPISSDTAQRESTVNTWMTAMADHMGTTETVRLGSRRLRTVSVGNLQRFNWWDPDIGTAARQAAYLDNSRNDYMDYHLYTFDRWTTETLWFTEYPSDPYTPMKYYLGVNVGVQQDLRSSSCTLPEIIDHNRYAASGQSHRLGGFFSSEFGLRRWEVPQPMGYPRKRLLSDGNHNYIWLAMATGSIGGPTPWKLAASPAKGYYDLSGINYLNPTGEALNYYTDEILDSMLSLSRFTSLVQWKLIGALYRPVRLRHSDNDPTITLRATEGGTQLSQNDWLWSAASDKTFTVGWIVRDCATSYSLPEWEDPPSTASAPWLHVQHLAQIPLELVWFDDHLGQIVGSRSYSSNGTFQVQTPNTEGKNGFTRSIAFLIQPTGLTPSISYTALPDEKIGMIEVSPRVGDWYEERQETAATSITFTARTKPAITNPGNFKFQWYFHHAAGPQTVLVDGSDQVIHTYAQDETGTHTVRVDIKDKAQQDKRVSGDVIELKLIRY